MATEVEICNSAIAKVRGRAILTMGDNTTEARILSSIYTVTRDKLLRSHPWNFAKKRTALAQLVTAPAFDFTYAYQLPSDCLRILKTDLVDGSEWALESDNQILCDEAELNILYIARITDASRYDACFTEVLAYLLAEQLALPLTNGTSLAELMAKKAQAELMVARSFNGQERGSQERVEADSWLNARY